MASENTFASLIANFGDFLTVAVHTILYERRIYPVDSFIITKKWNFPVRQSRAPTVCKWVNDSVAAVQEQLLKGTVERIAFVIFSQYAQPLERFIFDVSKFPVVVKEDFHTRIERQVPSDGSVAQQDTAPAKPPNVDLEEQFRAVMSKLSVCGTMLKPIPEACTYTVVIENKDTSDPPIGHPQPWIPVEPSLQREVPKDGSGIRTGNDLGGVGTTPIRSVSAGEMVFEMWIEEGAAKEERSENGKDTIPDFGD